jgi:hypothetical protein
MTGSEQKKKKTCFFSVITRETREGWPQLTVGTEANGDSRSTNDRDPSFWLVRWAHLCRYNRFLSSLGCSSRASTKYFFPHRTLFQFIFPISQQPEQAVVPGRLSPNVCLCSLWPSRPVRNGLRSLLISNLSQSSHSFFSVSLVFLRWKCRPLFTSSVHFLSPIYHNSRHYNSAWKYFVDIKSKAWLNLFGNTSMENCLQSKKLMRVKY